MDLSGISGINSNYQSAKADASAASSNALQNSLKGVSSDASEDELKGVIKDFESYFVEQMLRWLQTRSWIRWERTSRSSFMSRCVEI